MRLSHGFPALHPNTSGSEESAGGARALGCVWHLPFPAAAASGFVPAPGPLPVPTLPRTPGTSSSCQTSESRDCCCTAHVCELGVRSHPSKRTSLAQAQQCLRGLGCSGVHGAALSYQESLSSLPHTRGRQGHSGVTDSRTSAEPLQLQAARASNAASRLGGLSPPRPHAILLFFFEMNLWLQRMPGICLGFSFYLHPRASAFYSFQSLSSWSPGQG